MIRVPRKFRREIGGKDYYKKVKAITIRQKGKAARRVWVYQWYVLQNFIRLE